MVVQYNSVVFVSAMVGVVFKHQQDASFATFRMWQAFGFLIVFAYSHFLCMRAKTYISLALCTLAFVSYFLAEFTVLNRGSTETAVVTIVN